MKRMIILLFLFCSTGAAQQKEACGPTNPCSLVSFVRLSPAEATKAKQLAESLRDAEERNQKARQAMEQFRQTYRTAHPDLQFSDDFQLAVYPAGESATGISQVASIALTAEQSKKLASLSQEMRASEQSAIAARGAWQDFEHQFMADHSSGSGTRAELTLSSGKRVQIFSPWVTTGYGAEGEFQIWRGVAFTTDFQLAFPRWYQSGLMQ